MPSPTSNSECNQKVMDRIAYAGIVICSLIGTGILYWAVGWGLHMIFVPLIGGFMIIIYKVIMSNALGGKNE